MESLDKTQHEPFRKMSKCLYLKFKCITETILLFYSLSNISDKSNEPEVPFSHYIYHKPGVQFEHFSNAKESTLNTTLHSLYLQKCCCSAIWKYTLVRKLWSLWSITPVDLPGLRPSIRSVLLSFSFFLSLYLFILFFPHSLCHLLFFFFNSLSLFYLFYFSWKSISKLTHLN